MRNFLLIFVLLFIPVQIIGQENAQYKFDYYSLYTLKLTESEITSKHILMGNSTDDTFSLTLVLSTDDKIKIMYLVDEKNNRHYGFEFESVYLNSFDDFTELTKKFTLNKSATSDILNEMKYFEIKYAGNKGNELVVGKVFKNKKKTKLVKKIQYAINNDSKLVNNFHRASSLLSIFPIREVAVTGLLEKGELFNNKSKLIRTIDLVEIKPIELILNLQTNFDKN